MKINEVVVKLRNRLVEYRYDRRGSIISKHINAIDIAVCLVEYAIEDNRSIKLDEQNWFDAGYYISYVLDGSEWEDLSDLYMQLVTEVKNVNYFR